MALITLGLSRRALLTTTLAGVVAPSLAKAAPDIQERILVIGDSQAQGLAGGIQRLYRSDRSRRVIDHSKISTGLMPRPNYDWPAQAQIIAGAEHYDIAIMLIGANDRPPVHVGGRVDPGLLARFTDSYGQRVSDIAGDFRRVNVSAAVGRPPDRARPGLERGCDDPQHHLRGPVDRGRGRRSCPRPICSKAPTAPSPHTARARMGSPPGCGPMTASISHRRAMIW